MPTAVQSGLESFYAIPNAKAELDDKRAMAQERQVTARMMHHEAEQEAKATAILSDMYQKGGTPATEAGTVQMLDAVAKRFMGAGLIDKGMKAATAAESIRSRKILEDQRTLTERLKERQELGGRLGAITDQDTYNTFLQQMKQEGRQLPTGLTGDYEADKGKLQYHARSTMTEGAQLTAEQRVNDYMIRSFTAIERAQAAEKSANLARERFEFTKKEAAIKDARAAQNQAGRNVMSLKDQKDLIKAALADREDLQGSDMQEIRQRIANQLLLNTTGFKGDKESYADQLEAMIDEVMVHVKKPERKMLDPSTWFAKPKIEKGAPPAKAPAAPAEGTKDKSKSGKPIVFRNGHWEYE